MMRRGALAAATMPEVGDEFRTRAVRIRPQA